LLSHFERPLKSLLPDGKIDRKKFTLEHLIPALEKLLGKKVQFFHDTIGDEVKAKINELKNGDIILLENSRFYAGEEKVDAAFSAHLAELGDIYINDAFGAAHRAHASTSVIADHFDETHKAFGFLMKGELDNAK